MKINDLKDKKVAIWGLGVEGKSVLNKLNSVFPDKEITIIDDKNYTNQELDKDGSNPAIVNLLKSIDIVIRSPGVSIYKPEIIKAQKDFNTTIITEKTLFFSELEGSNVKTIGITGTKGKTTTSTFCAYLLEKMGYKVILAGNIGLSTMDILDEAKNSDFVVIETSSYQASDLLSFPQYSILLNLFHDHIAWHINYTNYYNDKVKLLKGSNLGIVNGKDEVSLEYTADMKNRLLFNTDNTIHYTDGYFYDGNEKLFSTKNMKLLGSHNYQNLCSVLTLFKELNLDFSKIKQEYFDNFEPVEHRLEILKNKNMMFISDSISTIPEASIACFKTFADKNIYAILGGCDKGNDITELVEYISSNKNIKFLSLMGDVKEDLAQKLKEKGVNNFILSDDMEECVKVLYNKIQEENDFENSIITLSPGYASFGLFKNYKERGDVFKQVVSKL